jgi:hypothetical protein
MAELQNVTHGSNSAGVQRNYLDIKEGAAYMRASASFVRKAFAGKVPGAPRLKSVTVGRRRLIRVADLEAWILAQQTDASEE